MMPLMKLTKLGEQIVESLLATVGIRVGTEEPKYTRRQLTNTIEIRRYGPRIAAETTVATTKIAHAISASGGWRATSSAATAAIRLSR